MRPFSVKSLVKSSNPGGVGPCAPRRGFDRSVLSGVSEARMNQSEFLSEFQRLEAQFGRDVPNVGCVSSKNLTACAQCLFSENLENCYRCSHCNDCTDCSDLTHSSGCRSCHASAYLIDSRFCNASAYLVHSVGCSVCNYCFGCVGLNKKDFHILNVQYSRSEYFEILKKLKRELGIR